MLLPAAFEAAVAPEAFVAWDDERRTISGAAAFHRHNRETIGVQVLTLKDRRRQRVGSALLARVVDRARQRGDERVTAWVDVIKQPETEHFLLANGFEPGPWTLRLEGEIEPARETLLRWRVRLVDSGKAPRSARIVEHRELPRDVLRPWYEAVVAPALAGRPEYARLILDAPDFDATILVVDGRPAGMLAGVRNEGNGTATIRGIVVAPEFQGGWGWANLLLLASGLDRAWAAGARRLRFETGEKNWKVLQAAGRVQAAVIGRCACFVRPL